MSCTCTFDITYPFSKSLFKDREIFQRGISVFATSSMKTTTIVPLIFGLFCAGFGNFT